MAEWLLKRLMVRYSLANHSTIQPFNYLLQSNYQSLIGASCISITSFSTSSVFKSTLVRLILIGIEDGLCRITEEGKRGISKVTDAEGGKCQLVNPKEADSEVISPIFAPRTSFLFQFSGTLITVSSSLFAVKIIKPLPLSSEASIDRDRGAVCSMPMSAGGDF